MTFQFIPNLDNLDDNPYARRSNLSAAEADSNLGGQHALASGILAMSQAILALALEIRRRPHVIDLKPGKSLQADSSILDPH